MAWYQEQGWGGFAPYVPVAVRRANALREAKKLERGGKKLKPVKIDGRAIATTFWGEAWCKHIETYSDYSNRLPRGRTYARNGSIIDLQLEAGQVQALVSGSELYKVKVKVQRLEPRKWKALVGECSGKIDSVVELLTGKLSGGVMELLCHQSKGVFPGAAQLQMSCSCPDYADLCKHLAAVLYGIGSRLDHEPELLFVLRAVDRMELVDAAGGGAVLGKSRGAAADELAPGALSEVFGIELDEGEGVVKRATRRKAAKAGGKKRNTAHGPR